MFPIILTKEDFILIAEEFFELHTPLNIDKYINIKDYIETILEDENEYEDIYTIEEIMSDILDSVHWADTDEEETFIDLYNDIKGSVYLDAIEHCIKKQFEKHTIDLSTTLPINI